MTTPITFRALAFVGSTILIRSGMALRRVRVSGQMKEKSDEPT